MPRIDSDVCNICAADAAAAGLPTNRALISKVGDLTLKQAGR